MARAIGSHFIRMVVTIASVHSVTNSLIFWVLLCVSIGSFGQSTNKSDFRFQPSQQNAKWMAAIKTLDRPAQWNAIATRLFLAENSNAPADSSQYSPTIVVNGVLLNVPERLRNEQLLRLLNDTSIVSLDIIDAFSKEWIFCKPFAGVIILTLDESTARKLFKLLS